MQCQCIHQYGAALTGQSRADMVATGTEVVLTVTATGVCHTDLHLRAGGYALGNGKQLSFKERGLSLPLVPGHEPTGIVTDAGPEAGDIDRSKTYAVYPWIGCGTCDRCRAGQENYCATPRFLGVHTDGGYATSLRVPHPRYLFDIGTLDPAAAAPLSCAGLTVFGAIRKMQSDLAGQRVVIIGAGGLGLMGVGMVTALGGAAPVVVDIDPGKRAAALAAGAVAAIDPASDAAPQAILDAVGGAPQTVFDFVGGEATARLGFDLLGKGGQLIILGLYGGATPWDLPMIPLRCITITGSYVGSLPEFAELMALARSGKLALPPVTSYPLAQADMVLDALEAGKVTGRAVLVP